MMSIKKDSVFAKSNAVASRRIEEETIVMKVERFPKSDHEDRVIRYFNNTGTFIWELIDSKRNAGQVIEEVVKNFEISLDAATKEVSEFLETLLKEDLVSLT